jgi:hypothetical protein
LSANAQKPRYDRSSGLQAISFLGHADKPATQRDPMTQRFLRTGVFLAPFHPLAENPLLALDRDMDLLIHLDRLNYHKAVARTHTRHTPQHLLLQLLTQYRLKFLES